MSLTRSIWQPVNPLQLRRRRYTLQSQVPNLQNLIIWHILRMVELGTRNLKERVLDDTEHDLADWFRSIDGAVEVPSSEIEFLRNGIDLFVVEWFV